MIALMLVLAAVLMSAPYAYGAGDCFFMPLKIEPADPGKYARYSGKGKNVAVELTNTTGKPADTFSDPPLRVRPLRGGKACDIDAGNWVRKHIYLSADENYLLAYEFSGSSDELVIYATATCERKNTVDLSGAKWSVDGATITIGAHCIDEGKKNCVLKQAMRLDAQCAPDKKK